MDFTSIVEVEGVLIEENRAAGKVGHVSSFMKDFEFEILKSFLQADDMQLSRNLFLNSVFLSTLVPRVQVVILSLFSIRD